MAALPKGSPSTMPMSAEGMASRMSGMVMERGDSWIFGSTAGSTWLLP